MYSMNTRRRILIAAACAALLATNVGGTALAAERFESSFEVLGPIPTDIKNIYYESTLTGRRGRADEVFDAPFLKMGTCLKARSGAYDELKFWQRTMHADLGQNVRHAIKNAEAEKAATKDPKRKKQIGEWETRLSVAAQRLHQQIDDEYAAAVKKVHFNIPCSRK